MHYWESDKPSTVQIQIEYTDSFDARGMKRVYGLGVSSGRKASLNMDIWRDRKGNLFGRFWSRNAEVDNLSFTILGIPADAIPERAKGAAFSDAWIPQTLRDEFENWITNDGNL